MNAQAGITLRMEADEFIAWSLEQPSGRHELVDGEVVAMAPERVAHVRAKLEAVLALRTAIRTAGLDCEALTDGLAVQVADDAVYEPDAMVRCGPRLAGDIVVATDPIIVVEVLSPSTRHVDTGKKLLGYFALPSLQHYLVLDPEDRTVLHYRRDGGEVALRVVSGEEVALDPPGLRLRVADLFEAA